MLENDLYCGTSEGLLFHYSLQDHYDSNSTEKVYKQTIKWY